MEDNNYMNGENEMVKTIDEIDKVRAENLVWVINRDYNIDVEISLLERTEIPTLTNFRAMILGAMYQSKDQKKLIRYFLRKKIATQNIGVFTELMMLTLEESLLHKVQKEFLGLKSLEQEVIADVVLYYDKLRKRRDVYHEIRYAYYTDKNNKVPKTNTRVVDLLMDIKAFRKISIEISADEYIAKLDDLLEEHFHFEKTDLTEAADDQSDKKNNKEQNEDQKDKPDPRESGQPMNAEPEQVMAAEFSQYDIGREKEQLEKDQADAPKNIELSFDENIYYKILETYGLPKIKGKALEKLEEELSQGIHANSKLHITDRFLDIKGYKKSVLDEAMASNLEQFEYSSRIYRRNIIKLKENLLKTITADMDFSQTKLDNGLLNASKIWRKSILNDNNIFYKNFRDERGEIIVDILLDASGSQRHRQNLVAIQAYIIAEALSQANIPCRVSSFNNLFDYTILKQYRDFNDSETQNKRIFSYLAEGSNRDGLAIATIGKLLLERPEEHKVLIILSDGKPNDERVTSAGSMSSSSTMSYTGDTAIEDTAQKVRMLRSKGIAVLGVFTGDYEDITVEQKIFGRDFAYISNIERFSDIVGVYLKKQISNMLESQY